MGGKSRRRSGPKDEFRDLVLSWSLEEISDKNLYKFQVEKIPESFECVDQYLGSYVYPLLEETRAELASAMETVYKAPFAEVTSFCKVKRDKLLYDVKVDHWRNRTSQGGEPYRTLPGDVVLLSDIKPETASDLQRACWTYTFASVKNIARDDESGGAADNCTSCSFKLKTDKCIEVEGDGQKRSSLFIVFLMNVATNKRIWNALSMRQNLKIIQKVLCKNDLVQMKEQMNFSSDAITGLTERRPHSGADKKVLCEASSMTEELNRLCLSSDTSDFDMIGELLKRFEAQRPQLDTLLKQSDPNGSVVAAETDEKKVTRSNDDTEDGKTEDLGVVENPGNPDAAECSKAKGKNKKNNKSRKGKGGRRK